MGVWVGVLGVCAGGVYSQVGGGRVLYFFRFYVRVRFGGEQVRFFGRFAAVFGCRVAPNGVWFARVKDDG